MGTKALRFFYDKVTRKIVWSHELREPGVFPTTIEEDLEEIPGKKPYPIVDTSGLIISNPSLGGSIEDYEWDETSDMAIIDRYFSFHGSTITINQVLGG